MRVLLPFLLLVVAACSSEPTPSVTIYAPSDSAGSLRALLDYTDFAFEIVEGDSVTMTDAIIAKRDSPRADILVTSSVIDIVRAADQGALRPLAPSSVQAVPETLRDPDGAWAAISHTPLLIGAMPGAPIFEGESYADLGSPELAGALCLTTSSLPQNRVLLAMLIEDLGEKTAERAVRRWVRNLAVRPFKTEDELAAALLSGTCKLAILSIYADVEGLKLKPTNPTYRDIEGLGVARHAQHPEAANELVAWLLQALYVEQPLNWNGRNIGAAGWRDEDARRLAERAGYR